MVVVLPEPFGPRKPITSPGVDAQGQVVQRDLVAETLAEPDGLDQAARPRPPAVGSQRRAGPADRCRRRPVPDGAQRQPGQTSWPRRASGPASASITSTGRALPSPLTASSKSTMRSAGQPSTRLQQVAPPRCGGSRTARSDRRTSTRRPIPAWPPGRPRRARAAPTAARRAAKRAQKLGRAPGPAGRRAANRARVITRPSAPVVVAAAGPRPGLDPVQRHRVQTPHQLGGLDVLDHLHVEQLAERRDAQPQRRAEAELGLGMEARSSRSSSSPARRKMRGRWRIRSRCPR